MTLLTAMTGAGYGTCSMAALSGYQPPCKQNDGRRPKRRRRQLQKQLSVGHTTAQRPIRTLVNSMQHILAPRPLRLRIRQMACRLPTSLRVRVRKPAHTMPTSLRVRVYRTATGAMRAVSIRLTQAATMLQNMRVRVYRKRMRSE